MSIMTKSNKATRIDMFNFSSVQMRTFHLTWLAFFLCFFGWFGLAPMLQIIRDDLGITTDQIVTTNMVAVASTVFMRLFVGWLCDKIGPRITYTWLLVLGSIPVMLVGLSQSYEQFLIARMFIGAIGASFVITQFHTSVMFAPNVVGTA
ncbi:MAG: MFS transporter, partial [Imperialibacter sp.]